VDVDRIRSDYDKLKSSMTVVAPFISSLMSRARIVVNRSVSIAGVTKTGVIVINPDFWEDASWAERAWALAHEVFHLAFRDHKRQGSRNQYGWNISCDAVNNEILNSMLRMPSRIGEMCVTMDKLYYGLKLYSKMEKEDFLRLSKEEVYRLLPKKRGGEPPRCPRCGSTRVKCVDLHISGKSGVAHMKCDACGYEWDVEVTLGGDGGEGYPIPVEGVKVEADMNVGSDEGDEVQSGDEEIYKDGREIDSGESDEKWREKIAKAYSVQKTIGAVPLGLERMVESILKPKIDWRSLLKQAMRVGLDRFAVETYRRPSRKHDDFPGVRRYSMPTVWVLVDLSASISDREAEQFIGEVYDMAGQAKVKVVCWDSYAYEPIEARNKSDVINKVAKRLRGGGGTVIEGALRKALKDMRLNDMVVILSDGDIYDLESDETKELFSNIAKRSSVSVFVSTHREVNIPGWRFIRLEVD
jgi:predicted metal-dependent peptidase